MTTTSEERREVAEKLRDDNHGYSTEYDFFLHALGMSREGRSPCDWAKVHERLADLIDPTCHLGPAHFGGFGCDRCFTWFPDMKKKPVYCPACGARVVGD